MPKQVLSRLSAFAFVVSRLFYAPVDGFKSFADKVSVCLAEVLAAEESAVGRKGARVRRGEDEVATVRGDERLFLDGKTAPQQEHQVFAHLREALDDGVGELLPANPRVACRHVGADRERSVEQKDSLVRPAFEVAVRRRVDSQVVVQFLEDVHERRGRLDTHGYGETQPVSLARIVVRVLPDDDPGPDCGKGLAR